MTSLLALFTVLFFVACLGMLLYTHTSKPMPETPKGQIDITPSIAAWLSGGPRRAVDTWWSNMRSQGFLVPRPNGTHFDGVGHKNNDNLDPWAARAFSGVGSNKTPHEILQSWHFVISQLGTRMETEGFIHNRQEMRRRKARVMQFSTLSFFFIPFLWIYFHWGILGIIPAGVALFFAGLSARHVPKALTPYGEETLQILLRDNSALTRAPLKDDIAMAVALMGPTVLLSTPYQHFAPPYTQTKGNDGASGGCGTVVASWGSDQSRTRDGSGCGSSGCGGGCGGGD